MNMTLQERAIAMDRVLNEPVFMEAVTELRTDALEQLISLDATNTDGIREAQALVKALDALTSKLRWTIEAAKVSRKSQHPA